MAPRLPRVYLIRHGETEWSLNGRHTGTSDIPLTDNGVRVLQRLAKDIVGLDKPLCPARIQHILVSPRQRAQKTLQLLLDALPPGTEHVEPETTEDIAEWDYGDYEGVTSSKIHETVPEWDIFTHGCPNGETPEQMQRRADRVVERVVAAHKEYNDRVQNEGLQEPGGDVRFGHLDTLTSQVLIVSHGHFSKSFLARWCGLGISHGGIFVVDAGAISVGSYEHHSLRERALIGMNLFSQSF